MSTIRVDYDNARTQAKQLQSAAVKCDEIVRQLRLSAKGVSYFWEGAAAEAFQEAMNKRIVEVREIGERAEALAVQIRRITDDLEEVEQQLKAAVEAQQSSRTSNGTGSGGGFSGESGFSGGGGGRSGGAF